MNSDITAATFAAYLKCLTKSYLTAHREKPLDMFAAETRDRFSVAYKTRARQRLGSELTGAGLIDFAEMATKPAPEATTLLVDCETALYVCDHRTAVVGSRRINRSETHSNFVPIVYSVWNKSDHCDELLVCFGALAIGQATGSTPPPSGKVVYGENHRIRNVRIADHLPKTRRIIEAIASFYQGAEPPLVLNKHCSACDFQLRCRDLAVEQSSAPHAGAVPAPQSPIAAMIDNR